MISTQPIIYCTNPECQNPINSLGNRLCASCQTPLIHRYLWAAGSLAAKIYPREKIADRYEVITRQIWLDTQPGLPPDVPEELPQEVIPYLRLYQERLHLPQAYGFAQDNILLLENVPIDESGNLYPAIAQAWEEATAVRQVYWLWQILQLWTPLSELGVASSLLLADNLRVQGWCVRLLELVEMRHDTSLQQLGKSWQPLIATNKTSVAEPLAKIVQQMCGGEVELGAIATELNALLISSAAELPLTLKVAGATDIGRELTRNEDACYPTSSDCIDDPLLPRVSIVCDGIGGHEGGEVASRLAVQSLKLQVSALFTEVTAQTEPVSPDLLQQQLEASLRVVNNVICACNDEQKRQGKERMGTTIVMAVQLSQRVQTSTESHSDNTHELYLANVGDSRAYWITRNYCQLLTVDDDVATREVRSVRSLYRKALQRQDATALTQALGIKDGEFLRFRIQRFILEEDGILLLCSDGLSDNNWVEKSWQDYAVPVLTGELSLEDAVHDWINLANIKNGHDNTSVVLTHCRVSPQSPVSFNSEIQQDTLADEQDEAPLELDFTESPATTTATRTPAKTHNRGKPWVLLGGLLALFLGSTSLGLFAWWQLSSQTFAPRCSQLPQLLQQFCPQQNRK